MESYLSFDKNGPVYGLIVFMLVDYFTTLLLERLKQLDFK